MDEKTFYAKVLMVIHVKAESIDQARVNLENDIKKVRAVIERRGNRVSATSRKVMEH